MPCRCLKTISEQVFIQRERCHHHRAHSPLKMNNPCHHCWLWRDFPSEFPPGKTLSLLQQEGFNCAAKEGIQPEMAPDQGKVGKSGQNPGKRLQQRGDTNPPSLLSHYEQLAPKIKARFCSGGSRWSECCESSSAPGDCCQQSCQKHIVPSSPQLHGL